MSRKSFYVVSALLAGIIVGLIVAADFDFSKPADTQDIKYAVTDSFQDAVVNVVNTTGEAVVSISTEYTRRFGGAQRYYFGSPFEEFFGGDDFFRRFFEDFFGDVPQREYKQMGLGSGTIIDADGYILTNEHVVSEADKISVSLADGRKFDAEIKGKDKRSDLAVIKINAHNLPVAKLGESDNLRIGDWVVAIGNPFGFVLENPEPTVTVGVISALHRSLGRSLSRERDYSDLIQTDAAINPGNSGGPLVNLKGEVVGINVAIFSTSGGYQGIGFAIPINNAKRIIARLISGKEILYGWLGVSVQELTPELAKHFGLPDIKGALVAGVLEDSPAQKGGIKEGDVIKQVQDIEIDSVRKLISTVSKIEVGKTITIIILRNNKKMSLQVEIGQRPEDLEQLSSVEELPAVVWRGIEVEELNPDLARRFQIKGNQGVVIVNVEPGSPADKAGLMPGDVILSINRQLINNLSDYNKVTKDLADSALIKTQRGYYVINNE
ncbi:MAG: Do family serine endopeptidase [Candidatus Omnitrophota bacterium]|jgi:serine protease Do